MSAMQKLSHSQDVAQKVALVYSKRAQLAREQFSKSLSQAVEANATSPAEAFAAPAKLWMDWHEYAVDAAQRTILFWDTLRQRGNTFVEHTKAGLPPVLHFDFEIVVDGRKLERPVNYALVKITAPPGVTLDDALRPYIIIDPRAGHGPGIGGFKDDSQVGVALRGGHAVYFVIFFRDPEPGQTLLDVCEAEKEFVHYVRTRHPRSPKPAIVGNCQGGWAAMMLAAADPDETGPIVINGAPMSYWGGAWAEGENDNPMRYAGGLLGGTWLSSLASDLGDGVFDGAYLVENFENLNPANTFWNKYYHLYANIDKEPPRFLEFERWWGGFYLMNREEIEWITHNLFVGNKVWKGEARMTGGEAFDLRNIKAPIILFASMGDNITPPQQAFNWVADVYGSTDEIKARGQVIVGLMHETVGHLGIFVSGSVAKKEHAQIVEVLKSVESLPPGLWGMKIAEHKRANGEPHYEVSFDERRLEDVTQQLNRFERADEKPFEAVAAVSDFNQRAYELFAQPIVQAMANPATAKAQRQFHPLRMQRWAFSDLNPFLTWLAPAAAMVKANRRPAGEDNVGVRAQKAASATISASLDYYRGMRDAASEAAFFLTYGNVFSLYMADKQAAKGSAQAAEARELPFVKEALASIAHGGYAEALARVACLLARKGEPLLLSKLELKRELAADYAELLPDIAQDEWRRVRGEQDIIVRYEPELALKTLPQLLSKPGDRERLGTLVQRLIADERMQRGQPTAEQRQTVGAIVDTLALEVRPAARKATATKTAGRKRAAKAPAKAASRTRRNGVGARH